MHGAWEGGRREACECAAGEVTPVIREEGRVFCWLGDETEAHRVLVPARDPLRERKRRPHRHVGRLQAAPPSAPTRALG